MNRLPLTRQQAMVTTLAVTTVFALSACQYEPASQPANSVGPAGDSPTIQPDPDQIPAEVRAYHDNHPSLPDEGYVECDGPTVTNYYPSTPEGWEFAVKACAESDDYATRLEDELNRQGYDFEVG